jgi:hypothetical protein
MTLVSSIIDQALRETNIIPLGTSASSAQSAAALLHLNPLVLSTVGREAGDELTDINFGGEARFDQSSYVESWVEDDTRLILNLSAADTVKLDPRPYEGQRFAIVDVGNTLDTHNLTIDPNGRKIEGSPNDLVLSTEGIDRQWMYRGDTGNWVRIASLATSDEMPFPVEYDPYFIIMLAARINPSYGQALAPETVKMLARAKSSLNARYRKKDYVAPTDVGLVDVHERHYSSGMTPFYTGYPRLY